MNTRIGTNALKLNQCVGFKAIIRTILNKSKAVDLVFKVYGPSLTPDTVPIIVLHGFLGSMRNWQSMCNRITSHTNRSVIAVDARNHGDSPHADSHNYLDLAADVSKLITKLAIKKSIIIGHSMGGRTAMVLSLSEPSKIASQVIADISPVTTTTGLKDFFPKVLEVMASVDFKGKDLVNAQKEAKNVILKNDLFEHPESVYFILMNIGRLPNNTYGWKCNVPTLKKDFHHIADFPKDVLSGRTFEGPVLFIGGSESSFIPPGDITGIKQLFPKAVLRYIPNVGHNVHAEDPNAFFNMVVQFLADVEKR
ncbi:sn-1-specific diacylglycerol lipase ABHD11 isoform X2 [Helicoverpa armigera]|uniref:sn-1-specific diacylglycerol lipase ABHD11 isoform X2 n=1 Tax=Helicoverpa armigera TaxID=29058 RepID=UPI003082B4DC